MGREALGEMNENGELFANFCAFNDLVILVRQSVQTQGYPQSDMDFISPDGHTALQIRSTSSQFEESGDAAYWTQGRMKQGSRCVGSHHSLSSANNLPSKSS
ncbi:unnamed protein product [Heterobilharzia americana]|nr:unnamed protein product [Heterobilharzia americana]CAH8661643.1 unnamed protein product [Heterobilharzia americana]